MSHVTWKDRTSFEGRCHEQDDVFIISPRERDTIIAALRLWQDRDEFFSGGRIEALDEVVTNFGRYEALDENEIDILIEDKINARPLKTVHKDVCPSCGLIEGCHVSDCPNDPETK